MNLLRIIEHWLDGVLDGALDELFREGWSTVHGLHTADGGARFGHGA